MIYKIKTGSLTVFCDKSTTSPKDISTAEITLSNICTTMLKASTENPDTPFIFHHSTGSGLYFTACAFNGKYDCGVYRSKDKNIYSMSDIKHLNPFYLFPELVAIRLDNFIREIKIGRFNMERDLIKAWQRKFGDENLKVKLNEKHMRNETYYLEETEFNEDQKKAYERFAGKTNSSNSLFFNNEGLTKKQK